jgi:plastocyanin
MRVRASAALALAAAIGMACDNTTDGGSIDADAVVSVANDYFAPNAVTVRVGGKVLWIWPGSRHNVVFYGKPGSPANCQVISTGACERTFPMTGQFDYTCTLHAGMDGLVNVTP